MKSRDIIILFAVLLAASMNLWAQQFTVAVSPFEARGGLSQDEAVSVTELFVAGLVADRTIRVVDRNNFDKITAEMKFQSSDWADSKRVAELGRATGANSIIRGTVMSLGGDIVITATALDINTAEMLSSSTLRMRRINEVFDKMPPFVSEMVANLPRPNTPAPAASAATGIAIEVSTNVGGTLHFGGKEIAVLWDNDSYTIPIEKPGTYAVMLNLTNGQSITKSVVITTRGISKVEFKVYNIGDRGPGGGLVFYASNGLYKECSSVDSGPAKYDDFLFLGYQGGGFTNWALPTSDEARLMYVNLKQRGLGNFRNVRYWTAALDSYSNQRYGEDDVLAYIYMVARDFSNGSESRIIVDVFARGPKTRVNDSEKNIELPYRYVRAFSE